MTPFEAEHRWRKYAVRGYLTLFASFVGAIILVVILVNKSNENTRLLKQQVIAVQQSRAAGLKDLNAALRQISHELQVQCQGSENNRTELRKIIRSNLKQLNSPAVKRSFSKEIIDASRRESLKALKLLKARKCVRPKLKVEPSVTPPTSTAQ